MIAGGAQAYVAGFRRVNLLYLLPMLVITGFCVLVPLHTLAIPVARAGIRTPDAAVPRQSFWPLILAGTITPAYIGESLRSVFMRLRFGTPAGLSLYILIVERSAENGVTALGFIGAVCAPDWGTRVVMLLFVVGAVGFRSSPIGLPPTVNLRPRSYRPA